MHYEIEWIDRVWRGSAGVCLAVVLAIGPSPALGAAYKWVDEQGVTHYSQTPPPDRDFKELAPPPPAVAPTDALKQLEEAQKGFEERRAAEREAEAKAQETADSEAERRSNCARARANLDNLLTHPRIRYTADDGSVRMLSEEERQQRIEEARSQIAKLCKTDN